jgi:hypothetical protein
MDILSFPVVDHIVETIYERGSEKLFRSQSFPKVMLIKHMSENLEANVDLGVKLQHFIPDSVLTPHSSFEEASAPQADV